MFCLMDVSGSMTKRMKDLAKRFYMLLYVFLKRSYKRVEIVFIRHTDDAEEVDEQTFFHDPETGGTRVSPAFERVKDILDRRFAASQWNIYAAQASDGDSSYSEGEEISRLLTRRSSCRRASISPISRSAARTLPLRHALLGESSLWRLYSKLVAEGAPLYMRKVSERRDFPGVPRAVPAPRGEKGLNAMTDAANGLLYETADWDFATLQRIHDACEKVALSELGLGVYPNQIEIITAEQMIDAYSSVGMPLYLPSLVLRQALRTPRGLLPRGLMGLAYEIVINSSPCISYMMEENTMTMQALVIAHAAFGHNHFFKNNYLFKQWTDADGILDYLDFAKKYVAHCEERHGSAAVERMLDAAHALMSHGVHRYPRQEEDGPARRGKARQRAQDPRGGAFNDLWRTTVPAGPRRSPAEMGVERRKALLGLPQENLLYFLEKSAPRLEPWQREILRIVRHIAQYFYPQGRPRS